MMKSFHNWLLPISPLHQPGASQFSLMNEFELISWSYLYSKFSSFQAIMAVPNLTTTEDIVCGDLNPNLLL
jgi:hypothetical protein